MVHRWLLNQRIIATPDLAGPGRASRALEHGVRHDTKRLTELLKKADLGIAGIRLDEPEPATVRVRLLHHRDGGDPVPLDLTRQESHGTLAWFSYLEPVLQALDEGSLLVIDELDASLHPTLSAELIRLFRDPHSNPRHAQLIFTTHDATLLGSAMVERQLDRDEVWITSKRRTGETELYCLIDAKPRKEENLERGYLRGRYGGIPRVTHGDIAREVADLRETG